MSTSSHLDDLTCKETISDNFDSPPRLVPRRIEHEQPPVFRPTVVQSQLGSSPSHLSFGIANVALSMSPQHIGRSSGPYFPSSTLLSGLESPLLRSVVLPGQSNTSLLRPPPTLLGPKTSTTKGMTFQVNTSRGPTVLQVGKSVKPPQVLTPSYPLLSRVQPISSGSLIRPILPAATTATLTSKSPNMSPVKAATLTMSPGGQQSPGQGAGPSPRPSILRKRPMEINPIASTATRKLVYCSGSQPDSSSQSSSQSSSLVTRPDSPTGSAEDTCSNHSTVSTSSSQSCQDPQSAHQQPTTDSPRKRQRKQQFESHSGPPERTKAIIRVRKDMSDRHVRLTPKTQPLVKNLPLYMLAPPPVVQEVQHNKPKCKSPAENEKTESSVTGEEPAHSDEEIIDDDDAMSDDVNIRGRDSITPPPSILTRPVAERRTLSKETESNTKQNANQPLYRPRPQLLANYELKWLPRKNHYKRPDEIRAKTTLESMKDEIGLRPMAKVAKLANDKTTWKRLEPFKISLLESNMDNITENEADNVQRLNQWINDMESDLLDNMDSKEWETVKEMALTFCQRNKAIQSELNEVKQTLNQTTEHGHMVHKLLKHYVTKRPVRNARNRTEVVIADVEDG